MLAAGTLAQASFSALTVGLAVLAPTLREEFDLSLGQIGALLSAAWLGAVLTLLPWGLAADRFGERIVLALGLFGASGFLVGAAHAAKLRGRSSPCSCSTGAVGGERQLGERAGGDALVRAERAWARSRDQADGDPARAD